MIRYLYSLLLFSAMGLPMWAKGPVSTITPSSKASAHGVLAPVSVSTVAKDKAETPKVPILTSDMTRAKASAKLLAMKPAPTPEVSHSRTTMTYAVTEMPLQGHLLTAFTPPESRSESHPDFRSEIRSEISAATNRLARVTAYWASEGDYYTGRGLSATGVHLHDGLCAVDPSIIPYGSVVEIAGLGKFLAVDTGSAVIDRTAAREGGHNSAERAALVIDIFFESRADGERFAASAAKYAAITWWTPMATDTVARAARGLFAEEDWAKIQNKQL